MPVVVRRSKRYKKAAEGAVLGTRPDSEVAKATSRTEHAVLSARLARRIPKFGVVPRKK